MDAVRTYRVIFIRYFTDNKLFESYRYITAQPIHTFVTSEEQGRIAESGNIPDEWSNSNNPYLDVSDVPIFQYQHQEIWKVLQKSFVKIAALLVYIILLLVGSIRSFTTFKIV